MSAQRLSLSARRAKLRAVLAGKECRSPASVFDAMSARVAESVGYELGLLGGSVASAAALAAPDLTVLTLTELAGVVRSICRASDLALFVDADHGYGNALSVRRTIEELEHAGASGCSIEDTVLPARFGAKGDEFLSCDEMVGKLRAAVDARQDAGFVIAGRTGALKIEGVEATAARAKAYAEAGVDAIFLAGVEHVGAIEAIGAVTSLPIICGNAPGSLDRAQLAALGVRILNQGHQPQAIAVEALRQTYAHLHGGGAPGDLAPRMPKPDVMDAAVRGADYRRWKKDYLG